MTARNAIAADHSRLVFYNFSEGSGAVIHDTSGYGRPLDLNISNTASTRWLSGGGLEVHKPALIASASAATKVINAVKKSNELTIEAWIDPANTTQSGPARIVTLSEKSSLRNFTLGQGSAAYNLRLRSTATNGNGIPYLSSPDGILSTGLAHVVYTRSANGIARLYINGVEQSKRTVGGDLGNWDSSYRFALADELTGDRPWLGRYYQVAVYSRAFDVGDVDTHFAAGPVDAAGGSDSGSITDSTQPGIATLNWLAPTARTDGSKLPVSEIVGYTLYYGQSAGKYSNSLSINGGYTTSVTVTDLPVGTWYFTVSAKDSGGRESDYSSIATKVVN